MRLIYIDDSADEKTYVFSAICIHESHWKTSFDMIRDQRREFRNRFGVYVRKELHATDLVAGRGQISERTVTKHERSVIFRESVEGVAKLPGVQILNACGPKGMKMRLFERLLNRLNKALEAWNDKGLLIIDEGSQAEYTRLTRRMGVYNPIPSRYGNWIGSENALKNLPINEIVEDPFFKDSRSSFFLQAADHVAFSLLRKENQLPSRNKYGIHQCFDLLDSVLVKVAYRSDPSKQGIIRA